LEGIPVSFAKQERAAREAEGDLRVVLFEAGAAYSPGQSGGVATGDLIFAEHLQKLEVAEFPVAGLGQAGIEGVEHAGEFEGLERLLTPTGSVWIRITCALPLHYRVQVSIVRADTLPPGRRCEDPTPSSISA